MKKLILAALLAVTFSANAVTGYLNSQWVEGQWRYCKYSNGKILTVKSHRVCPNSID